MPYLYLLFEHAAGYAIFKSFKVEDNSLDGVQIPDVTDIDNLQQIISLHAFKPFANSNHALENLKEICEGRLYSDLSEFVTETFEKKKKVILGVADTKLAISLTELDFNCSADHVVQELLRGIRLHFCNLVEGFDSVKTENSAQLGLGHSYSRTRVKYSVKRNDNMIIQSINVLDQLDKDINTFMMRVREWYSLYFPELLKVVPENSVFIQCVHLIRNRKEVDSLQEQLENIVNDPVKVDQIMKLAKCSMGMDISAYDLENVFSFVDRIVSLTERRRDVMEYLKGKMQDVAPNLGTLVGDTIAARLISHSGSLCSLAKLPASTVQILGAEKALFRALKTRGNTPKYGILYHSRFVTRANPSDKGRISRYVANKCSTASRIDYFRDVPTAIFGEELRNQVENRLKYLETGELPPKNVDVMTSATEKAEEADISTRKLLKKQKKKKKSLSLLNGDSIVEDNHVDEIEVSSSIKKKKKRKHSEAFEEEPAVEEEQSSFVSEGKADRKAQKKAAKKRRLLEQSLEQDMSLNVSEMTDDTPIKKKKKKKKSMEAAEE